MPSSAQLIRNAAGAAARVIGAPFNGKKIIVSPGVEAERIAICRLCEQSRPYFPNPKYLRCAECGCWLNGKILAKARLTTEDCPRGIWRKLA
jgi:hypothetical protein